jgi:predicted glycogen debranching enzyme
MSTMQILHRIPHAAPAEQGPDALLEREWLVTNGLGGYASGTISGACTRRYHGLLVAALPAPLGRYMMFNHLSQGIRFADYSIVRLDTEESTPGKCEDYERSSEEFRLEAGLPVWQYDIGPYRLEKRILLPYLQNTAHIIYRLISAPQRIRLILRPSFHFRPHDASVGGDFAKPYTLLTVNDRIEVQSELAPPLRMRLAAPGASLVLNGGSYRQVHYRVEKARGYEHEGSLWNPGYFRADLAEGEQATLVASIEHWDTIGAVDPALALQAELQRRERLITQAHPEAQQGFAAELLLAADQFVIQPITRTADVAVAHASGDEVRTVIAGYHWFTDWGRDTMISLEGLTLVTGRQSEAGYLLRTFGRYVRDGLIPNMFPEGEREGLYHTADATLWYFHALARYLDATNDRETLNILLPTLRDIVEHHLRGTRFGIHVDPRDGLLSQGAQGYQLTWMDAKVGDWVVTPRRGKAVEICALWYNALRLLERWYYEQGDGDNAATIAAHAEHARASFNARFWYAEGGYLYDVVDGEDGRNDSSLRPNQLLAISLDYPVLEFAHWKSVLQRCQDELLTPVGLRSLAPGNPDYKATYDGDLRSRDAAYHQGTVWAWLIGPFIDAWLRVYPEQTEKAQEMLAGFERHLGEGCLGSISEVFDAETPHRPRGCIAQAWSVAEVLRCLVKTAGRPAHTSHS